MVIVCPVAINKDYKMKHFALALLLTVSLSATAMAGVSYSDKKKGKVHFTKEATVETPSEMAVDKDVNADTVNKIEPAAGVEMEKPSDDVAKMIKLPRK
jgi:hypothetical protein